MSKAPFGTRIVKNGRAYVYVSPGWWQPTMTDEERRVIRSGNIPESWKPTQAEVDAMRREVYGDDA